MNPAHHVVPAYGASRMGPSGHSVSVNGGAGRFDGHSTAGSAAGHGLGQGHGYSSPGLALAPMQTPPLETNGGMAAVPGPGPSRRAHHQQHHGVRVSAAASAAPYPDSATRRANNEGHYHQHKQQNQANPTSPGQLTAVNTNTSDGDSISIALASSSPNRVQALFADLPPLPNQNIYNELVGLYFEKLPPTLAIIHRDLFLGTLASVPQTTSPGAGGGASAATNSGASPQRPPASLVFSMISLSARYHPAYKDQAELVRTTWYERAKRLLLPRLADRGTADMASLKTALHLAVYCLGASMWQSAYLWLGVAVNMCRSLGLYIEGNLLGLGDSEDALLSGPGPTSERWMSIDQGPGSSSDLQKVGMGIETDNNPIDREERRRCYWAVRALDIHVSIALKRPPMIASRDHFFTLNLPVPDATFYGIPGVSPTALSPELPQCATSGTTMEILFRPVSSLPTLATDPSNLGPSTYISALVDILSSVVEFRQHCHRLGFLAFRPSSENQAHYVNSEAERIELKMRTWWQRLPEAVRAVLTDSDTAAGDPDMIHSGIPGPGGMSGARVGEEIPVPQSGWWWGGEAEEYDFLCAGMAFWVIGAALFAPELNMTAMAVRLISREVVAIQHDPFGSLNRASSDDKLRKAQSEYRSMEAALTAWQSSPWFSRCVDYATRAAKVLKVIEQMSGNETRKDTPLFAFCTYQLGLINLLAARQLAVNPGLSVGIFAPPAEGTIPPGANRNQYDAALVTVFRGSLLDLAGASLRFAIKPAAFGGNWASFTNEPGSTSMLASEERTSNPNKYLLERLIVEVSTTTGASVSNVPSPQGMQLVQTPGGQIMTAAGLVGTPGSILGMPQLSYPVSMYTKLGVVDFTAPEAEIIQAIKKACEDNGFFVLVNHPIARERIVEMFDLSRVFHTELTEEEREKYSLANVKSNYFGYKSFGSNAVNAKGTRGGNATYNIQKPSPGTPARPQPDLFVENWDKITGFCQDSHRIAVQLLRYISRACGMDEEVVAREHAYGEPSGDHLRMMFYSANRNGEIEAEKEDPRRIAAHTDIGTITLLYSQPVGGLQILNPDGVWRFVKPLDYGSIVCNVGDILMAFTGGRFKSSWHTVLRPPPPQENLDRFSLVYFSRPNYNALCRPLVPVPQEELEGFVPIDYETWVNRKIARLNAKGKNFIHAEPTFEMVNHWRPLLEVGYDEENEGDGARYKNGVLVEK